MIYRFGPYVLDVDAYELRRGDELRPLQPRTFALLEYLVANPGRAVSKQELLDRVWPDVTVSEAALAQAIRQARVALGDADPEAIIQTVRGRGYRLALPVEVEAAEPGSPGAATQPATDRQLAAILFTDIAGYTALMAESEARGLRVRERHRQLVAPAVERHRGEVIEARGDECLALFTSVLDAVHCALWLKDAVAADPDLALHLGVHLGDVVRLRDEISGDGVNVARRICALTAPGELCVSAEAWQAIRNQPGLDAAPRGPQELKHVGRPVDVFAVERTPDVGAEAGASHERDGPRRSASAGLPQRPGRRARSLLVACAVLAVLVGWLGRERARAPAAPVAAAPPPIALRAAPVSLAVLPFVDMSPDASEQHFADGLSEEILNALAGVDGLHVVARTSSFAFKGRDDDVRSIGKKLGAASLVEGSVRRAGERLRITAQLIDTTTGFHLWSQTYDRQVEGVFAIQEDIAREIVAAVRGEVGPETDAALARRRPASFDTYQLFLRGRALANQRTIPALREARSLLEAAVTGDPDYADAHAALAHVQILVWDYAHDDPRDAPLLTQARASARRAIALDPSGALGHASLGNVLAVRDNDWSGAEAAYRRALALNPGLASVREQYGAMLLQLGRLDDAGAQLIAALEADPLSPVVSRNVGRYYLFAGDPLRAIGYLQRALELNPQEPIAPSLLFMAYTELGRDDEALDAIVGLAPAVSRPVLRATGRVLGLRATATLLLGPVRLVEPCPLGATYAAQFFAYVDWPDAMFQCLEESLAGDFGFAVVNPLFAGHRSDPRFVALLGRSGLAPPEPGATALPAVATPGSATP